MQYFFEAFDVYVDDTQLLSMVWMNQLHACISNGFKSRPEGLMAALNCIQRRLERCQLQRASHTHNNRHEVPGKTRVKFF